MPAIYTDLRVVELCEGVPGPFCGRFFVDLGADVTHIELPGGDFCRNWGDQHTVGVLFEHLNRGKRLLSMTHGERAYQPLSALILNADVLIVHGDWSPSIATNGAFSSSWKAFAAQHPHIVVCEITDLGHHGSLASHATSELVLQAMSGLTRYLGKRGEAPVRVGAEIAWHATGMAAFQATAASLLARTRTGRGRYVHVNALRALMSLKSVLLAAQADADEWSGFHVNGPFVAPDHGWKTADGYVTFDFRHDQRNAWVAFCEEIGVGHLVDNPAYSNWRATIFTGDRRHDLGQAYHDWFQSHTSLEVSATINRLGGISVPVLSLNAIMEHEQVRKLRPFVACMEPQQHLGLPFSLTPVTNALTLNGHSRALDPMPSDDSPLAGVKVVDASIGGVGPWAGSLLGMLGADVIKIESPAGDFIRNIFPTQGGLSTTYMSLNLNKQGMIVDLKRNEDLNLVRDLLRDADVWIENFRPGTAERLGVGFEDLTRVNPALIYASASGFGDVGPMAKLGATDPHVQAFSGLASLNGEQGGAPQLWRWYGHVDVCTAGNIVQGVLAALYARQKSGRGARVNVTMLGSALNLQRLRIALSAAGSPQQPAGSASSYLAPDQAFQALDEPVAITASNDRQWRSLCRVLSLDGLCADPRFHDNADRVANREALTEILGHTIATRPAWWWVDRLQKELVPCGRFLSFAHFRHHEHYVSNGIVAMIPCPTRGELVIGGSPWEFDGSSVLPRPGPRPGQHTDEIRADGWGVFRGKK